MKAICGYLSVLLMGILVLFSTLLSSPASAGPWTGTIADQQVSFDDNEYARAVQIVLDEASMTLHLVWMEDAPSIREIHYGVSTDLGTTWSSATGDRMISFPDGKATFEEASVAVGPASEIVVVWSEDVVDTREVHYGISTDGGVSFSSETADLILSDPSTAVDTGVPSVLIDAAGTIHVVWQQVVNGAAEVHYSRSTDGGATWSGASSDRVISFPDANGAITPILFAGMDVLFVAWREDNAAGDPVIHVGMSSDGGDTWSSELADREISQPVNLMTNLDAAGAPPELAAGTAFVVYTASYDTVSPFHYEAYATHTTDNGVTWSGETGLVNVSFDEDHTRSASNPDVFFSACGGALAAWDEEEDVAVTNEQHISAFDFDSGTWSGAVADEIVSFPDGEDGYRPAITGVQNGLAILPEGADPLGLWVAWTEFAGGTTDNYEVHLSATDACTGSSAPDVSTSARPTLVGYPNPARTHVTFLREGASNAASRIDIYDMAGRLRDSVPVPAGQREVTWLPDASDNAIPSGVYIALDRELGTSGLVILKR